MASTGIPLTVAIVGSGPSGFYAAGALLERADLDVKVDMFERLATPWGLVRFGVAPDHPKIKSVSSVYAKIAARESFRFFGNVEVGKDITRDELTERYDAVIYAVGTQADRKLGIPGEELPGSVAAVDFVGWYNGHPDYADRTFDLSCERAVVIGNGNVALDVARILCSPVERLAKTDIADHALAALADSNITEVLVVGRRGAAQAAFTTPELKELPEYTESGVDVHPDEVAEFPGEDELSKVAKRNLGVMRDYAAGDTEFGARHITLRFQRSPVELRGGDKVEQLVLGRNVLRTSEDGWVSAHDTGEREVVDTGLVLRAVGYRGLPIDGLPFDERRGVIPNEQGKVIGAEQGAEREYVVGWIKRGPTGIIGTNRKDSVETINRLLADLDSGALRQHDRDGSADIEDWLAERQPDLVTEQGWQLIDAAERAAGEPHGRPRVKLCNTQEMLRIALNRANAEV
ncbi:MAG TPA: FAD-dependent oxidoreductase [Pseudonocardia sp.]|uniref:FAD-dependent oxidoreductase n=1 Tax=Pseudonocardia sp. TaxID=60912 RepID=UPI002CA1E2B1|nr:FAD-dependent oxidoreductase [Pseudonocardia sp.]HTF49641.1 FAD-dependent oxidoreductase [Pseudonocardia sp.]